MRLASTPNYFRYDLPIEWIVLQIHEIQQNDHLDWHSHPKHLRYINQLDLIHIHCSLTQFTHFYFRFINSMGPNARLTTCRFYLFDFSSDRTRTLHSVTEMVQKCQRKRKSETHYTDGWVSERAGTKTPSELLPSIMFVWRRANAWNKNHHQSDVKRSTYIAPLRSSCVVHSFLLS